MKKTVKLRFQPEIKPWTVIPTLVQIFDQGVLRSAVLQFDGNDQKVRKSLELVNGIRGVQVEEEE